MTIKQQGGIFGRNPEFSSLAVDGDTLFVDSQNNRVGVGLNNPIAPLHVKSSGDIARFQGSDAQILIDNNTSNTISITSLGTGDSLVFGTNSTPRLTIGPTGELTVDNGNMVFPAGNGIDFSATSGTGTSELFDDYEEGTWTPVYLASTTNPTFSSYGLQSGYYTKVGEMVYVSARLRTNGYNSDGAGNLRIGGLPYASASIATLGSGGAISILGSFSFTSNPAAGYFISGGNYIQLNSNTLFTAATVSALGTGTADNDISFFGVYRAL